VSWAEFLRSVWFVSQAQCPQAFAAPIYEKEAMVISAIRPGDEPCSRPRHSMSAAECRRIKNEEKTKTKTKNL